MVLNMSGWWFQIFFIFNPTWRNNPIWLIFSNGLKPPTRCFYYLAREAQPVFFREHREACTTCFDQQACFMLLCVGGGPSWLWDKKNPAFSFIQMNPFWGCCEVFVKFVSPGGSSKNGQRNSQAPSSKEKAPETVPVKAPESVPVSPKNDPPVQHGYCCRGWGS